MILMTKVTLVARNVDEALYRRFKAEAVKRGLNVSQALEDSMRLWLARNRNPVSTEAENNNLFYNSMRSQLVKKYAGKYVVIAGGKLVGTCNSIKEVKSILDEVPEARHAIVTRPGVDKREELEWLGGSLEL